MNGTEQPATEAKVDPAAIAHSIASANVTKDDPQPAPVSGNEPAPATPTETQPAPAANAFSAAKPEEKPPEAQPAATPPANGQPAPTPSPESKPAEQKVETPAVDPLKLENEQRVLMGLPPLEPETPEILKTKVEESSREAHRLVMERKLVDASLADLGVELVRQKDGKFALKPNEKYFQALKDDAIPDVLSSLTDEEKLLVDGDVAKKIVKATMAAVAVKRPPAKAESDNVELPDTDVQQCFADLMAVKVGDKAAYVDIDKPEIQTNMHKVYSDPSMASFKAWANQSRENMRIALNLLHGAVYRSVAPRLAAAKDAIENNKRKQEEARNKPSTLPGTAGGQVGARVTGTPQDVAHRIASAGKAA